MNLLMTLRTPSTPMTGMQSNGNFCGRLAVDHGDRSLDRTWDHRGHLPFFPAPSSHLRVTRLGFGSLALFASSQVVFFLFIIESVCRMKNWWHLIGWLADRYDVRQKDWNLIGWLAIYKDSWEKDWNFIGWLAIYQKSWGN